MPEMIVLGAKRSKGVLQDGKVYDSTKLYVQTAMKDSIDQVGYASAEYNWGDSTNFEKIKDLAFPIKADVDFEVVTSGKTSQIVVIDLKPVVKVASTAKV